MHRIPVADSSCEANGSWALENVQIEDVIAIQDPEICGLVKSIAQSLQVRPCPQYKQGRLVDRNADNLCAETTPTRLGIALDKGFLYEHLEVAVQGALWKPGRRDQVRQGCTANRQ